MKKLTQRDVIALYLTDHIGQWFLEYELRGRNTSRGFIGDEAKKRCREFFPIGARLAQYQYNGCVIDLERSHDENTPQSVPLRLWRSPRQHVQQLPDGTVRVTYV